jgi:hypothetical protein
MMISAIGAEITFPDRGYSDFLKDKRSDAQFDLDQQEPRANPDLKSLLKQDSRVNPKSLTVILRYSDTDDHRLFVAM